MRLPYDLALDAAGRIYVADGELGRIIRIDPASRTVSVAARRLDEATCVVVGADGTIYATDIGTGRVVRVDASGAVTTLAEIPAAACLALHPSQSTLTVATLNSEVWRVDPVARGAERLPIPVEAPHGLDYDAAGNLFIASAHEILRVQAGTGTITTVARAESFKVHPAGNGSLFALEGDPSGGRILRVDPSGAITPIVGNGTLAPVGDGGPATSAGLLPSDVAVAPDGALLVTQGSPFPAIRRVDLRSGVIGTYLRG
jgi:sugar lactone lactonase YvrE